MAEDEDLELLRATRPPQQPHQGEQVPDNEIPKRPEQAASLEHDTSAEPSELDAPESRARVCEPTCSIRCRLIALGWLKLAKPGGSDGRADCKGFYGASAAQSAFVSRLLRPV